MYCLHDYYAVNTNADREFNDKMQYYDLRKKVGECWLNGKNNCHLVRVNQPLLQLLFALYNDLYKLISSLADNIGFKEVVWWLCGFFNGKIRFSS